MPQNPQLSQAWQQSLGENWKEIQATYLHTIGNLTLTGYNSEYSDRPFREKRDMEGGFGVSPILLNQGLGQLEEWGEAEIKARAAKLADWALQLWQYPEVEAIDEALEVQAVLAQVFPNVEALEGAKHYIQEVVDLIGYGKVEHIFALTYCKPNAISVNLGQWTVVSFNRKGDKFAAWFLLKDDDAENAEALAFEGLTLTRAEPVSKRWAGDKNIYLVTINWTETTQLPKTFLSAWKDAIQETCQIFKGWTASSYMNSHQPELARALVAKTPQVLTP